MTPDEQIKGAYSIPKSLADFLVRIGGRNPYGGPMYRLVFAESRYIQVAGEFCEWDKSVALEDRQGMRRVKVQLPVPQPIMANVNGKLVTVGAETERECLIPNTNKPLRTWTGIKEIKRYPNFEGIILERWYPAHCYGTRAAWDSITIGDGTPVLGPYPERGDYESAIGPWEKMPCESTLDRAVTHVERQIAERAGVSLDTMVRKRVNQALWEADKASEKFKNEVVHLLKDRTSFLLSSSEAAGRLRTEYGERAGLRHHLGN